MFDEERPQNKVPSYKILREIADKHIPYKKLATAVDNALSKRNSQTNLANTLKKFSGRGR